MKLAKQFDLNMTRQHTERSLKRLQNSEQTICKNLHKLKKLTDTHPESESIWGSGGQAKGLSPEEELHALFDGPTQHLSGRLSPPSANCSQESRTEKTATHGMTPASSDSKNLPEDAQMSKPDFDDDWENDDLLSDIFVLEVTQNPWLLSSCTTKTTSQIGSIAPGNCEPTTATSSYGSTSRAGHPQSHQITSHYTRISSKICTNSSTFMSNGHIQSGAIKQTTKTSPDLVNTDSEYQKAHALGRKQWLVMTNIGPGDKDLASSAGASGKDFDSLWGDGDDDDDDDDLLCQACDDLERISASREQQRDMDSTKSSCSSPEIPSAIVTTSSSCMIRDSRTVQSQHPTDNKHLVCIFACSHSIPAASVIHGNKQNLSGSASASHIIHYPPNSRPQCHLTPLRQVTGLSGENSHHSTLKRHQSDPGVLRNKGKLSPTINFTVDY